MKRRIKLFLSLLSGIVMLALQACDTSGEFDSPDKDYFLKYYGSSSGNQRAVDMIVNADGSIVILGESESGGQRQIYLLKLDAMGRVLNEKYFSGPTEVVKDIEPLGNDTYLILADTLRGPEDFDTELFKVNGSGDILGRVVFKRPYNEIAKGLTVLSNGKIMVAGTMFTAPNISDFMVDRYNSDLSVDTATWKFSGANIAVVDGAIKVLESSSGINVMAYTNSKLSGRNPGEKVLFAYFKVEDFGVRSEFGSLPGTINSNDIETNSAIKTPTFDPGYFVTGSTKNSGSDGIFVCKMRENLIYEPGEGQAEIYTQILPTGSHSISGISVVPCIVPPEGYFVICNDVESTGNSNIWLTKLRLNGQVAWSTRYGSEQGSDTAGTVAELPDGKILILGTVELGDNQKKVTLMKVNSSGQFLK